jgi:hypothetical protein
LEKLIIIEVKMINKDWNVLNIACWNKITFPENTARHQMEKLNDEIREWKRADKIEDKFNEAVDVYIAAAGLSRFNDIGSFICYLFQERDDWSDFQDAVNHKMKINTTRRWDKQMHHY